MAERSSAGWASGKKAPSDARAASGVPPQFLDAITGTDCLELLPQLPAESIDCLLTDPPYGISLDEWDVLHQNTNSALLGQSPAQIGKSGFRRRGKPINGWRAADRQIPREYQAFMER